VPPPERVVRAKAEGTKPRAKSSCPVSVPRPPDGAPGLNAAGAGGGCARRSRCGWGCGCGEVRGIILIGFGIDSTLTGLNGRAEVRDTLKLERISGTPDMDKQIADKPVDTGAKAKLFAQGQRDRRDRSPPASNDGSSRP
jgi:hypothetical protein